MAPALPSQVVKYTEQVCVQIPKDLIRMQILTLACLGWV